MAKDDPKTVRVPCSQCGGGYRIHRILSEHRVDGDPETYMWWQSFQIVQCVGCEATRFRTELQDEDGARDGAAPSVSVYPEHKPHHRKAKPELVTVQVVGAIYRQSVEAAANDLNLLAAAGLRACVEAICKSQQVSGKNLEQKVDGLVEAGLLAKPQAELLHAARLLGNFALHELSDPSNEQIAMILEIVETLISVIYVLPEKVNAMKKSPGSSGDPS